MYLSYSGWKKWDTCEFSYWNAYINKTAVEGPDDRLGSIFGSVTGKLFEDFYNEEIYRRDQPQGELMSRVELTIQRVLQQETTPTKWRTAGVLLWKGEGEGQNPKALYENVAELAADVRDAVSRGFRIIRHYRFLGKGARAEVVLDSNFEGHKIGGRADFIMRRVKPHGDEVILDGKGSKWRDKYVDDHQLKWYAMLFRKMNGRLPDNLGFVYWRYDPPESVDWVPVVEQEIDDLLQRVLSDIRRIDKQSRDHAIRGGEARKIFLPIADKEGVPRKEVEQACRFCPYATVKICPGGAQVKEDMHR